MGEGDHYVPQPKRPVKSSFLTVQLCGELLLLDRSDFLPITRKLKQQVGNLVKEHQRRLPAKAVV